MHGLDVEAEITGPAQEIVVELIRIIGSTTLAGWCTNDFNAVS